jgi:hypothetical protein
VFAGDLEVVVLDWDRREQRLDVRPPLRTAACTSELDSKEELRHRDGSDRAFILVGNERADPHSVTLGTDEDGRIEDQSGQIGFSIVSKARVAAISCAHSRSGP